jgi:hypothetical protein
MPAKVELLFKTELWFHATFCPSVTEDLASMFAPTNLRVMSRTVLELVLEFAPNVLNAAVPV